MALYTSPRIRASSVASRDSVPEPKCPSSDSTSIFFEIASRRMSGQHCSTSAAGSAKSREALMLAAGLRGCLKTLAPTLGEVARPPRLANKPCFCRPGAVTGRVPNQALNSGSKTGASVQGAGHAHGSMFRVFRGSPIRRPRCSLPCSIVVSSSAARSGRRIHRPSPKRWLMELTRSPPDARSE